jgi:hypothetical protein
MYSVYNELLLEPVKHEIICVDYMHATTTEEKYAVTVTYCQTSGKD